MNFKFKAKVKGETVVSDGFLKHKDGTIIVTTKLNEENLETSPIDYYSLRISTTYKDSCNNDIFLGDRLEGEIYSGIVVFSMGSFMLFYKDMNYHRSVLLHYVIEEDKTIKIKQ